MIKVCPRCESERPPSELFCEGGQDGAPCRFPLMGVPISVLGDAKTVDNFEAAAERVCENGHALAVGDYICSTCGAAEQSQQTESAGFGEPVSPQDGLTGQVIAGWRLGEQINEPGRVRRRFLAVHLETECQGVLTLYDEGFEPDREVYHVLQGMDIDHIPAILEFGRADNRPYEVREYMAGGRLAEVAVPPEDHERLKIVVDELGRALDDFAKSGLRHRELSPDVILVRDLETLDLVIDGFGSARLSDFDLDVVSPLETTRYMAPEAVAGGVAAASDWWSIGIILLEKLTGGACFEGIDDRAFLIQSLANGVAIPEDLPLYCKSLLAGLLVRDRDRRWRWPEVKLWLEGNPPATPSDAGTEQLDLGPDIELGDNTYHTVAEFAVAAADAANWEEACHKLEVGEVIAWATKCGIPEKAAAQLRNLARRDLDQNVKLTVALKTLNPDMPLVLRGEIINPDWLIHNVVIGYDLITGPLPDLLAQLEMDSWLVDLKERALDIRQRADQHEIDLDEEQFQVVSLSTSRARLLALWEVRNRQFPDSDHRSLAAIMNRRPWGEDDLVLLLAADIGQFIPMDELISEAAALARKAGLSEFREDEARQIVEGATSQQIAAEVAERIIDFAACGLRQIDDWADQFRLEKRLPLPNMLILLQVPPAQWQKPAKQAYVSQIVSHFEQKIALSIKRGPLARMTIAKTSARIDITELATERRSAVAMTNQIVDRAEQFIDLDPEIFLDEPALESRLRRLDTDTTNYRRDTGIDGLYFGFPFLVLQPPGRTMLPRIAPVLLWPIKLKAERGRRASFGFGFDRDREQVLLNPALEGYLGQETHEMWQQATGHLLSASHIDSSGVLDAFSPLVERADATVSRLPGKDTKVSPGLGRLVGSGVLFHMSFMGQAIIEDLRALKKMGPQESVLEALLRIQKSGEVELRDNPIPETEKYIITDSDPSQETAVYCARLAPGLVVEGPPGTGKSQTIVNAVADAVGTGKSLLLVCQKQAALDVVRKRLEAEGLSDRIVLVTDVNKDRRQIIREIREQADELLRSGGTLQGSLIRSRRDCATTIEQLEQELDAHHQALHRIDTQIQYSYRDIVGELIALEDVPGAGNSCFSLRKIVGPLEAEEISGTCERVGPLVRFWLPAEFEDSPLASTKQFSSDAGTLEAFENLLKAFLAEEQRRSAVVDRVGRSHHGGQISKEERFRFSPSGAPLEGAGGADLSVLYDSLQCQVPSVNDAHFGILTRLARFEIEDVIDDCNVYLGGGFTKIFSPSWWRARGNLGRLFSAIQLKWNRGIVSDFLKAAEFEVALRERAASNSEIALASLEEWFDEKWVAERRAQINSENRDIGDLEEVNDAAGNIGPYQTFRLRAKSLEDIDWRILAEMRSQAHELADVEETQLDALTRNIIRREALLHRKSALETQNPVLLSDHTTLDAKISSLEDATGRMQQLNRRYLRQGINVGKLGTRHLWEDITRLQGPRRKSLRQFFQLGLERGLFELRPIWLMNPDVASRLLPLNRGLFDVVVYDEASQIPVEFSLPTLFRGKTAVVSGDEKQLPPTSFFNSRIELEEEFNAEDLDLGEDATEEQIEEAEEEWNRREIKDCPDLLHLAQASLPRSTLQIHYRSRYRELIAYSNAAFYGNALHVPAQHPEDEILRASPIEVVRADGIYEDQTNPKEADEIIRLLKERYWVDETEIPPSIGVVTFNRKQADLIEARLEEEAETDDLFRASWTRELDRKDAGEDMGFFVKNVENVQGDERDVIMFSTTFGRNPQGTFRRNFGVLGQKGGERRLNVAISRAREKVILVTSMPVRDISDLLQSGRKARTPRDFLQGYMHFSAELSNGNLTPARSFLDQVSVSAALIGSHDDSTKDGFLRAVEEFIRGLGWEPVSAVDGSAFGIDYAIVDPATGLFGIGIECDAPRHALLATARARELWRPKVLSHSIPMTHRVSSHGWFHDQSLEQDRLERAITAALGGNS